MRDILATALATGLHGLRSLHFKLMRHIAKRYHIEILPSKHLSRLSYLNIPSDQSMKRH